MKKALKSIVNVIVYAIAWILSLIFNNFILKYVKQCAVYLRSINFKRQVKKCGKNPRIGRHPSFGSLSTVFIGNYFRAGDGFWLATYPNYAGKIYCPKIVIGNNVSFSRYCHVGAINHIEIGDNTLIGSNVLITDHAHGESYATDVPRVALPLISRGGVTIGKNVWICDNVCILPGVTIGNNCIIAAGSVVTKSFEEEGLLIGGAPARVIKKMEKDETKL